MRYSQQANMDCLVASVENLLDVPRSALPPIQRVKVMGEWYPTYKWVADTLREYGTFAFEHQMDLVKNHIYPMTPRHHVGITGMTWADRPNQWHAVYQWGRRIWCGHLSRYVEDEAYICDALTVYRISPSRADSLDGLYALHDKVISLFPQDSP